MKKKLIGFGIVAVIVAVAILYFTRTSVNTNTEIHAYIQTSIEQNSGISLNVAVKLIGAQLEDDLYEICDNNCEDCKRTGMQCVVDELLNDTKLMTMMKKIYERFKICAIKPHIQTKQFSTNRK